MKKALYLLAILFVLPAYSTSVGDNPGSDINSSVGTSNSPNNTPSSATEHVGPDSDSGLDSNDQGNPHFPNTNSPPSPHTEPSNPSTTQPNNNY